MYGRNTHLEQLNSKFASTNLLVYERDTGLVDEKHRVRDTSKGFVGRVWDILVRVVEREQRRQIRRGSDEFRSGGVLAERLYSLESQGSI